MFDNDISPKFAEMLRPLGVDVVSLREKMPASTKDPDFLGDLVSKFLIDVFISNNTGQRTNIVEAALLKSSGVTSLYFMPFWSGLGFWSQAGWLVNKWNMIDGYAKTTTQGSCADIQQNGRMRAFHL
jgi:hypothetical protein